MAYIDGFNLYFGLKDAGFRRYYWLDMEKLCRNLLKPDQHLVNAKYFTARITGPRPCDPEHRAKSLRAKAQRQTDYLDALATRENVAVFEGHYLPKQRECLRCGNQWCTHEEKMTDVNIATELLVDAFEDYFDVAMVISGDSDLTPPIKAIRRRFPDKRIVVAFPPNRRSSQLQQAANAYFTIHRRKLAQSQLPDVITLANGHDLTRPERWQ